MKLTNVVVFIIIVMPSLSYAYRYERCPYCPSYIFILMPVQCVAIIIIMWSNEGMLEGAYINSII